jgi:hypothetical protein
MNLESMNKDELIAMLNTVMYDQHTGYMLGSAAAKLYSEIEAGKTLVYVDMCNVHACNHKYSTAGTNERWMASFGRKADKIFKWGGDEFVILLDNEDLNGFIDRLIFDMQLNDVYAVVAIVPTSTSITETVDRADRIVMATKLMLEETGQKPHRDAPYCCLNSVICE